MKKSLEEAEKKARLRDIENKKKRQALTDEEIQEANELQNKATARGMLLIPEKRIKDKARFLFN